MLRRGVLPRTKGNPMRTVSVLFVCLWLAFLAAAPAHAACTATRVGNNTWYACDDGRSGSSTAVGNSTYYQGSDGSSGN